jgi:hypothetical protein
VPDVNQFTGVIFAGYKNKYFYIGADYSYKTHVNGISGHDTWGISSTNGIYLSEKSELFFRYDYAKSRELINLNNVKTTRRRTKTSKRFCTRLSTIGRIRSVRVVNTLVWMNVRIL